MELGDGFTIEQLPAVGNSALLTLWARAVESRSADPILVDPKMSCITDLAEIGHAIATG